jgi:phage-related minor tail protein
LISNNLNKEAVETLKPLHDKLDELRALQSRHIEVAQDLEREILFTMELIAEKEAEYEQELQKWELSFFGRTFPSH